ncbi:protein PAT1 homolog 1 [Hetaerina americana]|uniref:protein PAT1 homolog 1 n=1 Tax=Hetaerina americana TaxID=62018 RepID=UPI003A7F18EA
MEEQLADSFFGFDATLSGTPDDLNDETEDGQDEEFYDALNEETFGTDAVEGDWEQDHEKLAEITESARVRSNSYNGAGDRYNENGADLDGVVGGDSDLADSISRMVFEDQEEILSPSSKGTRNYPLQMENFDGSYSSSAPSGFSLWSNGGLSKGPQHQPVMTVPAASGTIWDPAVLQTSSAKDSGNALSSLIPSVRTVKDLERHLLHGRDGQSEQSAPSPSGPLGGPIGPLPKPSAAWLLEDIERELTSTSVSSQTTTTAPTSSASPASILPPSTTLSASTLTPTPAAAPVVTPVGMGRTFSTHRPPLNLQRTLPHHIPPHQQHPPGIPPPPHAFLPGNLPPAMLPPQASAPPLSIVDLAVRQMIQPPLAAIAQNQRLMGTGGPANMLLFMSKDGGPQQRGDSSKGFLDAMRVSDRLGSRVPHPNHLHQGGVLPNFNHPLHQHSHPHRVGPDFGRPHGFPPGHNGQMPRFPHPPYPIPNQQMQHRGFFAGRQGNAVGNFQQQFHQHHHHPPPHLIHGHLGGHHPHLHHLNGSEEWDEYAGLMTQWEKQFLLNIQRMQLQSDRPYVDDYYYTMYARRKKEREMAAGGKGNGLLAQTKSLEREHNLREKDNKRTEHHKYTPAQFENSLGKLQVVSVMAPRKIIDLDMTPPEKLETGGSQLTARDSRRIKLEIERLYTFLLQIEDLKIPWIEKQDFTTTESKEDLLAKILNSLQQEEKLSAILNFRKGKMLVVRLLPHLEPELQTQLWIYLFRNLPSVIRKDSADSCLPLFIPHFQKWASEVGPGALSQIVSTLVPNSTLAHSRSPSPLVSSKNPLTVALGNKFGSSSVVTIAERIIELQSKGVLNEGTMEGGGDRSELSSKHGLWSKFLDSLFDSAAAVPEAAATFKGSILSQHRLTSTPKGLGSSPSPTLPTLPEGESWTISVERLAALSKALHSLNEEAAPVKSSAKLVADS